MIDSISGSRHSSIRDVRFMIGKSCGILLLLILTGCTFLFLDVRLTVENQTGETISEIWYRLDGESEWTLLSQSEVPTDTIATFTVENETYDFRMVFSDSTTASEYSVNLTTVDDYHLAVLNDQ